MKKETKKHLESVTIFAIELETLKRKESELAELKCSHKDLQNKHAIYVSDTTKQLERLGQDNHLLKSERNEHVSKLDKQNREVCRLNDLIKELDKTILLQDRLIQQYLTNFKVKEG